MSQSTECPRCRQSVQGDAEGHGAAKGRCPACGIELIAGGGPKEAEVRRYLYHHRLLPLAPAPGAERSGPR
jgi:hypothetical protein